MSSTTQTAFQSLRQWVVEHDDRWLFIALYIGLAVVLSIWISLFWLVVVVSAHLVLELARQAHFHRGGGRILAQALWEIKLDIGLVLMALALALYMEVLFGLLGLQSAARMSAVTRAGTRGVRFAAWERTLRGILLSADDAAQVARVFARRNNGGNNGATDRTIDRAAPEVVFWRGSWSLGDRIALGLMVISLALVLLAPWLTDHTGASALATLAQELQPFPD